MLGIFSSAFNLAARTDDWGQPSAKPVAPPAAKADEPPAPPRKRIGFTLSALD
jgi:hypothetical protein